jgi:hypothetical protein
LYFAPDVHSLDDRPSHRNNEALYLALFADATDELRLGEATTRYLVSHEAPRLIRAFAPNAFIVAMLRNPVEMLHALHNERVSQLHEPLTDFAAALAADDDRRTGRRLVRPDLQPLSSIYLEYALYAEQLERWLGAIDRRRIHVIVFEDFVADTARSFREVLEFLEVDSDYRPAAFAAYNESHRQHRLVRRVLDSRPGTWLTHDLLTRVIGGNARARLAMRFRQSRLNRRPAPRAEMPAQVRRDLEAALRPDVARLSELLGRDMVELWFGARRVGDTGGQRGGGN